MNDEPEWLEPTPEQQDQILLLQIDLIESLNRFSNENFPRAFLLTALASACADAVASAIGVENVPGWFLQNSKAAAKKIEEWKRRAGCNN
jgi:putative N-acetylmannosamine-6-phosphate epimerase